MSEPLTLADIKAHPPPFGSVVHISPREVVVFAKHRPEVTSCCNCALRLNVSQCKTAKCLGGIYIPRQKYLEMRLLGEL